MRNLLSGGLLDVVSRMCAYDLSGKADAEVTSLAAIDVALLIDSCAKTTSGQINYENYVLTVPSGARVSQ